MKTEKRKMKGSVLLTVVSVMGLLIIFLSGTLVLATAANRRAHRSYSTSQAELTAKAAIESFTAAMADNEKIAAAVQNLDKTYHPTVSINDPSLGHIGYYDGSTFIENAITIEPLTTSGKFVHGKFDLQNPGAEVWKEAQQVKITVTARVGKEEKTVSALLNKVGMSTNVPSDDIGLYAGGEASVDATAGKIYSPFAEGLTTNGAFTCEVQNDTEFFSPVIFFNSSAKMSQQNIIHVLEPKQGTVVRGDLEFRNPFYISLEYAMTSDYTQKDIPYLFVEGDIKGDGSGKFYVGPSSGDAVADKNYSPYNVFAGSIGVGNPIKNMKVEGDIYLMDAGKTSVIGPENEDGGNLYHWADSVYNKTANQNYSTGGNIYSKGSIKFNQGIKVNGDVRVEGDVNFAQGGSEIWGDLVVGGTITGISNVTVHGTIYNDSIGTEVTLKPGYSKLYGTYVPKGIGSRYKKVENIKVSNFAYPNISAFEGDYTVLNRITSASLTDGTLSMPVWTHVTASNVAEYPELFIPWTLSPKENEEGYDQNHKIYVSPDGDRVDLGANGGQTPDVMYYDTNNNKMDLNDQNNAIYVSPDGTEVKKLNYYSVAKGKDTLVFDTNGNVLDLDDNNNPTFASEDGSIVKQWNSGNFQGGIPSSVLVQQNGSDWQLLNNYDATDGLKYYPVDKDGNEIPGADPVTESESFYRADIDGNVTDISVPEGETWTYYLVDVNGNAAIDDAGKNIVIDAATTPIEDLEYTYYDMLDSSGTPKKIAFAAIPVTEGCYEFSIPDPVNPTQNYTSTNSIIYTNSSGAIVSESEAMSAPGGDKKKIAEWTAMSGDNIYPQKMEKKVIYGSVVAGKFQKSTDTNQFIMTLDDMRNKISYRENAMGDFEFDSTKYPTTEPANVDKPYTDSSVQSNGVITKSCVISGTLEGKNIVIRPENEMWVILDNVTMNNGGKIVVDSNAGGDCKFFIKGTLTLKSKASIYSTLCMKNGDTIRYNNSLHIYYYGAEGSKIVVTDGNSVITGYGRCPKTSLNLNLGTGPITVNYLNEQGHTFSINPAWIGNVIYDGSTSQNNLTFALVKEGGGGKSGTIKTGIGYFEYEYFSSN